MKKISILFLAIALFAACKKDNIASTMIGTWRTDHAISQLTENVVEVLEISSTTWQSTLRDSVVFTSNYSLGKGYCKAFSPARKMTKLIFGGSVIPDDQASFIETKGPNTLIIYTGQPSTDGGATEFTRVNP